MWSARTTVELIDQPHSPSVLCSPLVKLQPTVSGNSSDVEDGKSLPFRQAGLSLGLKDLQNISAIREGFVCC